MVLAEGRHETDQKTRLRYHGGMHSAFEKTPHALLKLFIERLVSYGLTLTRTSNCWNDYTAFKEEIADLKKVGMDTVANLIYSVSPRHTRRILCAESLPKPRRPIPGGFVSKMSAGCSARSARAP